MESPKTQKIFPDIICRMLRLPQLQILQNHKQRKIAGRNRASSTLTPQTSQLIDGVLKGERSSLAKSITLGTPSYISSPNKAS